MAASTLMDELMQLWHDNRVSLLFGLCLIQVFLQVCIFLWRRHGASSARRNEGLGSDEKAGALSLLEKPEPKSRCDIEEAPQSSQISRRLSPKRIIRRAPRKAVEGLILEQTFLQPLIFFYSLGGSTEKYAQDFLETFNTFDASGSRIKEAKLLDLSNVEYDDYFTNLPNDSETTQLFYIFLIPSYDIDTNLSTFLEHLRETHHDFRIDTSPLSNLRGYAVFGFGDGEGWPSEEQGFCSQAKEVDKWMAKLTDRKRAYPLGTGDVKSPRAELDRRIFEWRSGVQNVCNDLAEGRSLGEGVPGSGDAIESDEEEEIDEQDSSRKTDAKPARRKLKSLASTIEDVENIAPSLSPSSGNPSKQIIPIDFTTTSPKPAPPMVTSTSPTYAALTKQGYTILGTHSGVKLCRWTKSALRGRGSCYKHSFYGIASHLCMETTPSLSCSNKCVFCWRHGTNPVGTTWRWQIDPPESIFSAAKAAHLSKIRMLRGVPGVRADRFADATNRIAHCALSLVGEPVFYPHINDFVALLHRDRISSFLVCNAQHPVQLAALRTVTQLYVSIDAADPVSLRKIDRPLHRDYWTRFLDCMDIVRAKRRTQRTVFRLTLVKGFNLDSAQIEGYADLVARALPAFIEVKGVTYCGTSTSAGAGLSMANVPFYAEVAAFCVALDEALAARGLDYGLAAEHAHSCCVLLADRSRFFIDGKWCTVIDYARFFELLEQRGDGEFTPEQCVKPTEEWALWGNGGFDPRDERVRKKGKAARAAANSEAAAKATES